MKLKRSMFQLYVKEADKALAFYQKAFGAELNGKVHWDDANGKIVHAEINVFGQIVSLSEWLYFDGVYEEAVTGNVMQMCLHFEKGNEETVHKAYEVLKEGAEIYNPPGDVGYSECGFGVVDRFGVSWCIWCDRTRV